MNLQKISASSGQETYKPITSIKKVEQQITSLKNLRYPVTLKTLNLQADSKLWICSFAAVENFATTVRREGGQSFLAPSAEQPLSLVLQPNHAPQAEQPPENYSTS